jgi:hypothetical protein
MNGTVYRHLGILQSYIHTTYRELYAVPSRPYALLRGVCRLVVSAKYQIPDRNRAPRPRYALSTSTDGSYARPLSNLKY